ncbi:hypothetical protein [Streptomyces sp. NBC_00102]|uniref:hypothetical protein n=1 Tax=Streptomyces sp. NBC_00102 TaxID=2975652 RepID=UPI002258BD9F|nr:hypothetical protein [Streptomyces sp. NBC_00102]MCX5400561.1 hypothetical protein [Streptomyces sp. NBC_00102]
MNVNRNGSAGSPLAARLSSRAADRWGTRICAVVLVLGILVTGYLVCVGYLVEPDGSWDTQAVTDSQVGAGLGLFSAALLTAATWIAVRCAWLRRYWYAAPAALALAALLRLTLLAPDL